MIEDHDGRVDQVISTFIAEKASSVIGPGCVVGTSIIVFEFIGKEGRIGYGVLRQKNTNSDEALDLLIGATDTVLGVNDKKFPYDEDYPDDL